MIFVRARSRGALLAFFKGRGFRQSPEDPSLFEVDEFPHYLRLVVFEGVTRGSAREKAAELFGTEVSLSYVWVVDPLFRRHFLVASTGLAMWEFDHGASYPVPVRDERVARIESISFSEGRENESLEAAVSLRMGIAALTRALNRPLSGETELVSPDAVENYKVRALCGPEGDPLFVFYFEQMGEDSYAFGRYSHRGKSYRIHRGTVQSEKESGRHAHFLRSNLEKLSAAREALGLDDLVSWYIKFDPLGGGLYAIPEGCLRRILEREGECSVCRPKREGLIRVHKVFILFFPDEDFETTDVTAFQSLRMDSAGPDFSALWRALSFVSGRDLPGDGGALGPDERVELASDYIRARYILAEIRPYKVTMDRFLEGAD